MGKLKILTVAVMTLTLTFTSTVQSNAASSGWECVKSEDGLGRAAFSCQSHASDGVNNYYVYRLVLACTSERKITHSIIALPVVWASGPSTEIRIDSKPIETWATDTRSWSLGTALFFKKGTKFLLTKIAKAKTFGFSAYDEEGVAHSARFNVKNSVPIAAKFAAMGCKTELK